MGFICMTGGNENVSANVQKAGKEAGRLDGGKLEGVQPVVGGKQGRPPDAGSDRSQSDRPEGGHGRVETSHRQLLTDSPIKGIGSSFYRDSESYFIEGGRK